MNIVAIIQARMGSTRLPCKMMLWLHGMPVIDWVVHRVSKSGLLNRLIVATSKNPLDDPLAEHLEKTGAEVFRGPEDDVLKRFRLAAEQAKATHVVRICADNPLIWGGEIDNLIHHYRQHTRRRAGEKWEVLPGEDSFYAYNNIPKNNKYPDGFGAEMISWPLLRMLDETARQPAQREHCFSYIWDNPDAFTISTFDPPDIRLHHPELTLDMDTPEDYRKLALMPIRPDTPPEELVLIAGKR